MSSVLFSENFLRWASILREFCDRWAWTKMSFPFCILILDFISRVKNFEISFIKGCDRMRSKMFKFGAKINTGGGFNRLFQGLYRFISRILMTLGIKLIKPLIAPQFLAMVSALFSQPLRKVGWNKSSLL